MKINPLQGSYEISELETKENPNAEREEREITYRESGIRMFSNFSSNTKDNGALLLKF